MYNWTEDFLHKLWKVNRELEADDAERAVSLTRDPSTPYRHQRGTRHALSDAISALWNEPFGNTSYEQGLKATLRKLLYLAEECDAKPDTTAAQEALVLEYGLRNDLNLYIEDLEKQVALDARREAFYKYKDTPLGQWYRLLPPLAHPDDQAYQEEIIKDTPLRQFFSDVPEATPAGDEPRYPLLPPEAHPDDQAYQEEIIYEGGPFRCHPTTDGNLFFEVPEKKGPKPGRKRKWPELEQMINDDPDACAKDIAKKYNQRFAAPIKQEIRIPATAKTVRNLKATMKKRNSSAADSPGR